MNTRFLLIAVLLIAVAGCTPGAAGTQVWFDKPLPGSTYTLTIIGMTPVEILLHASSPGGVSQVELFVNGDPLTTLPSPDPSAPLVQISTQWSPGAPGKYTLIARAQSTSGDWSNYATTVIQVVGSNREQPSPVTTGAPTEILPDFSPTDTPVPTRGIPTATPFPTRVIPPTDTPLPTRQVLPTSTPLR